MLKSCSVAVMASADPLVDDPDADVSGLLEAAVWLVEPAAESEPEPLPPHAVSPPRPRAGRAAPVASRGRVGWIRIGGTGTPSGRASPDTPNHGTVPPPV